MVVSVGGAIKTSTARDSWRYLFTPNALSAYGDTIATRNLRALESRLQDVPLFRCPSNEAFEFERERLGDPRHVLRGAPVVRPQSTA